MPNLANRSLFWAVCVIRRLHGADVVAMDLHDWEQSPYRTLYKSYTHPLRKKNRKWIHKLKNALRGMFLKQMNEIIALVLRTLQGSSLPARFAKWRVCTGEELILFGRRERLSWKSHFDFLKSWPAYSALIQPDGVVLANNFGWKASSLGKPQSGLGIETGHNFLENCSQVFVEENVVQSVMTGIPQTAAGRMDGFQIDCAIRYSGSLKWCRFKVISMGAPNAPVLLMFLWISKRMQSEIALVNSHNRLLNAYYPIQKCQINFTDKLILTKVNSDALEALEALEARDGHQIIGRSLLSFIHPNDVANVTTLLAGVGCGSSCSLRHRMIGIAGRERWFDTDFVIVQRSAMECEWAAISADITGWLLADAEFCRSREAFDTSIRYSANSRNAMLSTMLCPRTDFLRRALLEASLDDACESGASAPAYPKFSAAGNLTPPYLEGCETDIALKTDPMQELYNIGMNYWCNSELAKAKWAWDRLWQIRDSYWSRQNPRYPRVRVLAQHWISNIGHFLLIAAYIKLSKLGLVDAEEFYLVLNQEMTVGNSFLLDQFRNHLHITTPEQWPGFIPLDVPQLLIEDHFYIRLKGQHSGLHVIEATEIAMRKWRESGRPPLISTPPTTTAFENFKKIHGIGPDDWFVVLHARSEGFAGSSVRDSNITDYMTAVETILSYGGLVVRIGDASMPSLPKMKGLVDHACDGKDPSIDVLLCAQCCFFLGGASGPGYVPPLFNRPCLYVNWAPAMVRPVTENDYFLPKLYFSAGQSVPMSIESIMASGFAAAESPELLQRAGITVQDNTPQQIKAAVEYFYRHVIQGVKPEEKDIQLQECYDMASRRAGVIGAGKVLPQFVSDFPEVSSCCCSGN